MYLSPLSLQETAGQRVPDELMALAMQVSDCYSSCHSVATGLFALCRMLGSVRFVQSMAGREARRLGEVGLGERSGLGLEQHLG